MRDKTFFIDLGRDLTTFVETRGNKISVSTMLGQYHYSSTSFTPSQAREVAAALIEKADDLEKSQATTADVVADTHERR